MVEEQKQRNILTQVSIIRQQARALVDTFFVCIRSSRLHARSSSRIESSANTSSFPIREHSVRCFFLSFNEWFHGGAGGSLRIERSHGAPRRHQSHSTWFSASCHNHLYEDHGYRAITAAQNNKKLLVAIWVSRNIFVLVLPHLLFSCGKVFKYWWYSKQSTVNAVFTELASRKFSKEYLLIKYDAVILGMGIKRWEDFLLLSPKDT
mmetsp:Transcript_5787/g.12217  ORF Transcript_5787/g.12217 Transcript_5787/m.12217 type:complete len:207 (+) Transcript_5787:2270-2890(+)